MKKKQDQTEQQNSSETQENPEQETISEVSEEQQITQQEVTEVFGNESNNLQQQNYSLEEIASNLKEDEVDKMRKLLDKREKQFSTNDNTLKFEGSGKSSGIGEIEVEGKITDDTMDQEVTMEIQDNDEEFENDFEYQDEEQITSQKEEPIEYTQVYDELKTVFGEQNISNDPNVNSFDQLEGKEILNIQVKNQEAFDQDISTLDQNTWFIENIKKFSKLKEYKMLNSEVGKKDLAKDLGEQAIIISFRAKEFL